MSTTKYSDMSIFGVPNGGFPIGPMFSLHSMIPCPAGQAAAAAGGHLATLAAKHFTKKLVMGLTDPPRVGNRLSFPPVHKFQTMALRRDGPQSGNHQPLYSQSLLRL